MKRRRFFFADIPHFAPFLWTGIFGKAQSLFWLPHYKEVQLMSVKQNSTEIIEGTDKVVREMEILSSVTHKITDSVGSIAQSMEEIRTNSMKNLDDSRDLSGKIGGFKL